MKPRKFRVLVEGKENEVEVRELGEESTDEVVSNIKLDGKDVSITVCDEDYRLKIEEVITPIRSSTPEAIVEEAKERGVSVEDNAISSPMQGTVTKILVKVNDTVKAGDPLVLLEAMKMENQIDSTLSGIIKAVHVSMGDTVAPGDPLVSVK